MLSRAAFWRLAKCIEIGTEFQIFGLAIDTFLNWRWKRNFSRFDDFMRREVSKAALRRARNTTRSRRKEANRET